MKKEYGIARCGLACLLCSENDNCKGCNSLGCKEAQRFLSMSKQL